MHCQPIRLQHTYAVDFYKSLDAECVEHPFSILAKRENQSLFERQKNGVSTRVPRDSEMANTITFNTASSSLFLHVFILSPPSIQSLVNVVLFLLSLSRDFLREEERRRNAFFSSSNGNDDNPARRRTRISNIYARVKKKKRRNEKKK